MAKKKKEAEKKPPVIISLNGKDTEVGKIAIEDIITYCKKNNEVAWLKDLASQTRVYVDKETKEEKTRKISFIEIRNEFLRKFYPEQAPKKKEDREKKKTFYDLINEL